MKTSPMNPPRVGHRRGRTTVTLAGVLAACVCLCSGPVTAVGQDGEDTPDIITRMSAGRIERIVQAFDDVENFTEVGNNTYRFEFEGLKIVIFNKTTSMQLYAAFDGSVSLSRINEWNRTKRFTKAYLDDEDDPVLESDIELNGGVTEANVDEWIKTYAISLQAYVEHLAE